MNQQLLFTDEPTAPHSGPDTSKAAAKKVPKSERVRQDILAYLEWAGTNGATDGEMQVALHLSGDTQRARRWELCGGKHGQQRPVLIVDSGRTRPTASGCQATVWVVKPQTQGE